MLGLLPRLPVLPPSPVGSPADGIQASTSEVKFQVSLSLGGGWGKVRRGFSGCPGIQSVDQAGLEMTASAS